MSKTLGSSIFDEPNAVDASTKPERFKFAPTFIIDLTISSLYVVAIVPSWGEALKFGWPVQLPTLVLCLAILACYFGKVLVIGHLGKQGGDARTYVKSSALVVDGPYRYSRHPTYAVAMAQCFLWTALAFYLQLFLPWRPLMLTAAVVLPAAFFFINDIVVMPAEEAMLRALHPQEFDAYARRVRRWFGRRAVAD